MALDWAAITHVTKADPAEELPADLGVLAGTDAVLVGGSDGVTAANTLATIRAIKDSYPDLPVLQEPYSGDHVSTETADAADYIAVPAVYNGDWDHFVGKHVDLFTEIGAKPDAVTGAGLPVFGELIAARGVEAVSEIAEQIVGEGYVIQNLDSRAAAVSGVEATYSAEEVAGAALATESFYGFPIFYLEYSGTYGDPAEVAAAARYLEETILLYGGGIDSGQRAREMLDAGADAVVVGDCFHDDPERFRATIP
ncbi:MAG: heptaprenylglyceryl phosphate synthase [Haloarculaceae archaeon]